MENVNTDTSSAPTRTSRWLGVRLALGVIFVVSICATVLGLTFGRFLGRRVEEGAELWAGGVLVLTGVAFILAKAFNVG